MTKPITRALRYLVIGLTVQQVFYGIYYTAWIDFSKFTWTCLFFELIFLSYLVLSAISESAIEPMKFKKKRDNTPDNLYTPTKY